MVAHLDSVREDVVEHAEAFQDNENGAPAGLLNRYRVNLLVDNAETRGAPVVYEDLPNHQHLTGQIEHLLLGFGTEQLLLEPVQLVLHDLKLFT